MNFRNNLFIDFKKKFGGIFTELFPNETPAYIDSKDNVYLLKNNTEQLIKKSIEDNINYLLNNDKIVLNSEMLY